MSLKPWFVALLLLTLGGCATSGDSMPLPGLSGAGSKSALQPPAVPQALKPPPSFVPGAPGPAKSQSTFSQALAKVATPLKLPAAPKQWQEVEATSPNADEVSETSQLAMARLLERRGEIPQAEQFYRAILAANPNCAMAHHRLAVVLARQARFEEVEKHLLAAEQLGTTSADLFNDLGYAYYLQQRLPEAEQALRRALQQDPRHDAATTNLGLVLGTQGRYDEALALFKQTGSEAEAYANLAYVFAQTGRLQQAEETYLKALTLDSELRVAAKAMLQVAERRRALHALAARENRPPDGEPAQPPSPSRAEIQQAGYVDSIHQGTIQRAAGETPAPGHAKSHPLIKRLPPSSY